MAGAPKKIESSEKLWEYFQNYKLQVKTKPITIKDWVGKDAVEVHREKEKPLTMEGFENWLEDNDIINDLGDYLSNKNDAYKEFSAICSRIKRSIRQDQIEGGMAGIYNPSITQRLNNLVERTDVQTGDQPIITPVFNVISTGVPLANKEGDIDNKEKV